MDKFWMVWNPNGYAPTYKHTDKDSAKLEAVRLAKANGNDKFFILEAQAVAYVDRVEVDTLHDPIPF